MDFPKPIRIRCKITSSGQQVDLTNVVSTTKLYEFLGRIADLSSIPIEKQILIYGYPRQKVVLNATNRNQTLEQLHIKSGDVINVDRSDQSAVSQLSNKASNFKLVKLTAPSDNSCLFNSVLFLTDNSHQDHFIFHQDSIPSNLEGTSTTRAVIASIVAADSITYSEVFLGQPNLQYCREIAHPDKWGGAIELSILSQILEIEICSVDIKTGSIYRFGEDMGYTFRIILIYDGIHYDPLLYRDSSTGLCRRRFPTTDELILAEVRSYTDQLRQMGHFTDLENFTLRCLQCQIPLKGQEEAQEHARATGHTNYGEYHN